MIHPNEPQPTPDWQPDSRPDRLAEAIAKAATDDRELLARLETHLIRGEN